MAFDASDLGDFAGAAGFLSICCKQTHFPHFDPCVTLTFPLRGPQAARFWPVGVDCVTQSFPLRAPTISVGHAWVLTGAPDEPAFGSLGLTG